MIKRTSALNHRQIISASILIAALGYFVDIYDLILFSIVRVKSLSSLGVPDSQLMTQGVTLLNMQMGGMLIGGIIWGILGDKKGRLSVLLGSIFLYSLANIANAFVHDVTMYAVLRFIAGVGLAGELGAGITLVSEVMPKETRGYGTMIVATVGILGAVVASLVGDIFDWRMAFVIGGLMGFGLLILRIKASESPMFKKVQSDHVPKGNILLIFKKPSNALKYICCILIGMPLWFVIGILITFSPEFGKALNMSAIPSAGKAIMYSYMGLALGGFASGCLSQIFKSRRRIVAFFMLLNGIFIVTYLFNPAPNLNVFYATCFGLGIASGYWTVFVTIAAEQFGTNIRSTVATTVPNFVRGSVVPLTLTFQMLRAKLDIISAAFIVAAGCIFIAFIALVFLNETHGRDLNYLE